MYKQTFAKGHPTSEIQVIGDATDTGTTIKFKPDKEIFSVLTFDSALLKERLRDTAFLNPGLRIKLIDDRFGAHEEETFFSEQGIEDFIKFINKDATTVTSILKSKKQEDQTVVEFAMQYTDSYEEKYGAVCKQHKDARRRHACNGIPRSIDQGNTELHR